MVTGGLVNHIAVASESVKITFDDISTVAAAVAKQVARDFGPIWGVQATVQAFASLEAIPSDYWQVVLVDSDGALGIAGYHTDAHGQPLSVVQVSGFWPATVSHEVLEMLGDPSGNRIVSAELLPQGELPDVAKVIGTPARVDYLVEVCDPIEAVFYQINGVPVSDFVLPGFYSSAERTVPGDFMGQVPPREIADGGYISFRDPATAKWFQLFMERGVVTAQAVAVPNSDRALTGCLRMGMDCAARQKRKSAAKPWRWTSKPQSVAGTTRAANLRTWLREVAAK